MSTETTAKRRIKKVVAVVLTAAAVFWVALLMGFASDLLTNG